MSLTDCLAEVPGEDALQAGDADGRPVAGELGEEGNGR